MQLLYPKLIADFVRFEVHLSFTVSTIQLHEIAAFHIKAHNIAGFDKEVTIDASSGVVEGNESFRTFRTKVSYGTSFDLTQVEVRAFYKNGTVSSDVRYPINEVEFPLKAS